MEGLPFGQNPLLLFPIFLIMCLSPVARSKPSGSTGSEEGTEVPMGGMEGEFSLCQLLPVGHSGHGGNPGGPSLGAHAPFLWAEVKDRGING